MEEKTYLWEKGPSLYYLGAFGVVMLGGIAGSKASSEIKSPFSGKKPNRQLSRVKEDRLNLRICLNVFE